MADNVNWYVVHTYSGYENTVKATIEKYVENRHLQDVIHEISIPLETVTEITDNGPKEVERKVFPGYVLVKMVMNDETWHVVRNIRGVTGFLGEGNKPIPLSEDDVAALGVEKREIVVGYQVGDSVKITDGALESFLGTVVVSYTHLHVQDRLRTRPNGINSMADLKDHAAALLRGGSETEEFEWQRKA